MAERGSFAVQALREKEKAAERTKKRRVLDEMMALDGVASKVPLTKKPFACSVRYRNADRSARLGDPPLPPA